MKQKSFWEEYKEKKRKESLSIGILSLGFIPIASYVLFNSIILYLIVLFGCWLLLNAGLLYIERKEMYDEYAILPDIIQGNFYFSNAVYICVQIAIYYSQIQ